jgi:phosphoribosyl-ATP pyrophosphohydrolase
VNTFNVVRKFTAHLDDVNGCDHSELILRVMKVGEENGEANEAVIGWVGQNPRKGVTHTPIDIVAELADVAFSALVAIQSFGFNAEGVLEDRARFIHDRAEL